MTKEQKANMFLRRRLRFRILRRDGFRCMYCGRGISDNVQLTIDHIVPKTQGGELISANLITACLDCNFGKQDDVLSEWEIQDLKREIDYLGAKSRIVLV